MGTTQNVIKQEPNRNDAGPTEKKNKKSIVDYFRPIKKPLEGLNIFVSQVFKNWNKDLALIQNQIIMTKNDLEKMNFVCTMDHVQSVHIWAPDLEYKDDPIFRTFTVYQGFDMADHHYKKSYPSTKLKLNK